MQCLSPILQPRPKGDVLVGRLFRMPNWLPYNHNASRLQECAWRCTPGSLSGGMSATDRPWSYSRIVNPTEKQQQQPPSLLSGIPLTVYTQHRSFVFTFSFTKRSFGAFSKNIRSLGADRFSFWP